MAKPVKKVVREIVELALGQTIPDRILQIVQATADPKWEVEILTGLMPYCYPKLTSVEAKITTSAEEDQARLDKLIDFLETE